jgi:hypothetical protein
MQTLRPTPQVKFHLISNTAFDNSWVVSCGFSIHKEVFKDSKTLVHNSGAMLEEEKEEEDMLRH